MKRSIQIPLSIIFWVVAAVDIIGITTNNSGLHYAAKPLLIPILMLLLVFTKTTPPRKNLLLTGLFFSWVGDMFLLFESRNNLFFIFGLVAFLTTHIFYIIYFLKIQSTAVSLLKKQPLLVVLVLGYGVTLVYILFPYLKELKIPVMVYAAVICTMLLCSLHVFFKVNKPANLFYIAGALLFVLSDSLLAMNKFYQPLAYAGVLIMLTYCAAQYFIVCGFIKQQHHD
jgi:uncharacterized membrane protein YhhN